MERHDKKVADHPVIDWKLVDLPLRRAKEIFAASREVTDFQNVGNQCSEVLIALWNAVGGIEPGIAAPQAAKFLREHIQENAGAEVQPLAQVALETAATLYKKANQRRLAGLCVEATATLVNLIALEYGRVDSLITLADLIPRVMPYKKLSSGDRNLPLIISRSQIGQKPVMALQPMDIVHHCEQRKAQGVAPQTIVHDVGFIRGILKIARERLRLEVTTDAVDEAKGWLEKLQLVGKSTRRTNRPQREDLDRLLSYFREQDKHPRTKVPMAEVVEFAMWSGRRIGDICEMKWSNVDFENRRYVVSDSESYSLVGPVWTIVQRQPRVAERIFPYHSKTASARYTLAKKALGISNLRLNDLRLEAAIRLRDAGHPVEDIAQVIGRKSINMLIEDLEKASPTKI